MHSLLSASWLWVQLTASSRSYCRLDVPRHDGLYLDHQLNKPFLPLISSVRLFLSLQQRKKPRHRHSIHRSCLCGESITVSPRYFRVCDHQSVPDILMCTCRRTHPSLWVSLGDYSFTDLWVIHLFLLDFQNFKRSILDTRPLLNELWLSFLNLLS